MVGKRENLCSVNIERREAKVQIAELAIFDIDILCLPSGIAAIRKKAVSVSVKRRKKRLDGFVGPMLQDIFCN